MTLIHTPLFTIIAKRLWLLAKPAVACGMIWFLLHHGALDWRLFLEGAINLKIVALGLLLNLTMISLGALRWQMLLNSQKFFLPFSWTHRMTYLTTCFNLLVPGSVGGDLLRMGYVVRKTPATQKGAAILTIMLDRAIGLYSLFVIAFLAMLVNLTTVLAVLPLSLLALSMAMVVFGGPLAMLLLYWGMKQLPMIRQYADIHPDASTKTLGRIGTIIYQTATAIRLFRRAKGRVIAAMAISVVAQTVEIVALLWIASGLEMLTLPADNFFVAAPLAWVANIAPISPGGLGVGEAAFAQICQWLQPIPSTTAFGTIFLVNRVLQMLAALPGLWFYLAYRHETAATTST